MRHAYDAVGTRFLWAMLLAGTACLPQPAHAQTDGSRLYAACVVCHQPAAWGSPDGAIPNLAGQRKRYLERQLELFRTGARVDTAMQVVTAHPTFSDRPHIVAIAAYLSQLAANPSPVTGGGAHLRVGQEIFGHICAACHGIDGRGEELNRVPRIAGQHYPYLKRQIESAADLHRELAPPEMTSALRGMHDQEKDALADYISRMGSSDGLLDSNARDGRN
jgi:cytochrome c553